MNVKFIAWLEDRKQQSSEGTGGHWLLTTSDREHGGKLVVGIFASEKEAWEHYYNTHDENQRYWRIPFVEQWENEKRISAKEK